ncbi:MAG: germination protein YpeB [Eubacterium sp.]|nr:germination protein YpeB [Eubacterium sp.]
MSKRAYVRLSSFLAFALITLIALTIVNTRNMNTYKKELEVNYQGSLSELNDCLDKVNTNLTKSVYSSSDDELYEICRDLYSECNSAKNAVSRLPVTQLGLGNVYKFLSQASDYSVFIANKLKDGKTVSDKEHKNLLTLLKYAQRFSASTENMMRVVSSGVRITDGKVKNTSEMNLMPLSNSFSQSAKAFDSFPVLLYDGPFSDNVLNRKSSLLQKAEVKTKRECRELAAKALGVNENLISFEGEEKSKLPCYTFKYKRYTVSVTKQGGYIKTLLYSGISADEEIDEKTAVKLAKSYLEKIGYKNMKESYFSKADNVCTFNFAYSKNGVVYYSDLIKVSVSLENGKILSLDAKTYLTNHRERGSFTTGVSIEDAQKNISKYLKVKSKRPCVIPKKDGKEVRCYEYLCTSSETGEDALIYVNASTGREEDIMLLLYTDGGTLVK